MQFDKISPAQLRIMRIVTAAMFMALGAALAYLGGEPLLADTPDMATPSGWALPAAGFVQGVFLINAGLMLLELTTSPPRKMAINVPFVAANFQTALSTGLVALGPALYHMPFIGTAAPSAPELPVLVVLGFAINLTFVVMTKMHWNYTENTGKPLPKG